jgi:t-SNARE complex subunit (syntaxin)
LSKLVQYQGEIIDNIEQNIKTSKDFVLKAEKDIVQSKKNMQSARKKKCCILFIVIAIMIVILAPTLGTTLSKA